ncbi:flavin reductase family protein [Candidatus Woesearchaeota archaeon]|nr:flavin reductase family protein [Candidatus Woesearchaeota archaeon]
MLNIFNPRQTVLVSCRAHVRHFGKETVKDNMLAIDWHSPLSFQPMMYCFALAKKRYSYELIRQSKAFVINFISAENEKQVLYCGRNTGRVIDKFKETGLTKEEAESIDCCRIKEAVAYLECEVKEEIETGDHILVIGTVLKSELKENKKRIFHTSGDSFTTTV